MARNYDVSYVKESNKGIWRHVLPYNRDQFCTVFMSVWKNSTKFSLLLFWIQWSHRNLILHMSRQLSCRGMCIIVTWCKRCCIFFTWRQHVHFKWILSSYNLCAMGPGYFRYNGCGFAWTLISIYLTWKVKKYNISIYVILQTNRQAWRHTDGHTGTLKDRQLYPQESIPF